MRNDFAEGIKTNNKSCFKYTRSRKPARKSIGPVGDQECPVKISQYHTFKKVISLFLHFLEELEGVPTPKPFFIRDASEELLQVELLPGKVMG